MQTACWTGRRIKRPKLLRQRVTAPARRRAAAHRAREGQRRAPVTATAHPHSMSAQGSGALARDLHRHQHFMMLLHTPERLMVRESDEKCGEARSRLALCRHREARARSMVWARRGVQRALPSLVAAAPVLPARRLAPQPATAQSCTAGRRSGGRPALDSAAPGPSASRPVQLWEQCGREAHRRQADSR